MLDGGVQLHSDSNQLLQGMVDRRLLNLMSIGLYVAVYIFLDYAVVTLDELPSEDSDCSNVPPEHGSSMASPCSGAMPLDDRKLDSSAKGWQCSTVRTALILIPNLSSGRSGLQCRLSSHCLGNSALRSELLSSGIMLYY